MGGLLKRFVDTGGGSRFFREGFCRKRKLLSGKKFSGCLETAEAEALGGFEWFWREPVFP